MAFHCFGTAKKEFVRAAVEFCWLRWSVDLSVGS